MSKRKRPRFSRIRRAPYTRYRRFRKGKAPIPLLPVITAAYPALIEPILGGTNFDGAWKKMQSDGPVAAFKEFADVLSINFTGYKLSDGTNWGFDKPIQTYTMIGMGILGHFLANKAGINRQMKKIPMIGKYIAI